jgi:hypothetical protein
LPLQVDAEPPVKDESWRLDDPYTVMVSQARVQGVDVDCEVIEDFVLVGGVAAIAYGARRPTADLDCVARRSSGTPNGSPPPCAP